MTRYIIKKYVEANSLEEALKLERKIKPDDAWKDEKQPEPEQKADLIGFDTSGSGYYYSPYMKRKKKGGKHGRIR